MDRRQAASSDVPRICLHRLSVERSCAGRVDQRAVRQGRVYSVPLAATLGLPLYINSEASLPLIRGLLDSGMSQGAVMAFLIAGSGTSMGAIAGALTIARWRVVGLVVGVLWIGAMCAGFAYDFLLLLAG